MAKLLLCHQFFWPDVSPYGSVLKSIGGHWAEAGHAIEIFTTETDKARKLVGIENENNLVVHRVSLPFAAKINAITEFLNGFTFLIMLLCHVVKNRHYSLIMISTMPPILSGFAGSLAATISKSKFIYHLMDIYPEAIEFVPGSKLPSVVKKLAFLGKPLDNFACSKADRIVVLSEDMADTIHKRCFGRFRKKTMVLPNFAVPSYGAVSVSMGDVEQLLDWQDQRIKFIFAGNIGKFQGLDFLLLAFAKAIENGLPVQLCMLGDGSELQRLRVEFKDVGQYVRFAGQVSREVADLAISSADVCVVSLAPGVNRVAFPTKISNYLHLGKPLLGLCETGSSIEKLIDTNKIGANSSIDDTGAILSAVKKFCDHNERLQWSENAKLYGKRYVKEEMLENWTRLLVDLEV